MQFIQTTHAYTGLTDIGEFAGKLAPSVNFPTSFNALIVQAFYVSLAVVIVLALFGIIRGGYVYMTSADSASNKDKGKKILQAAIGGLALGLGGYLILNTINPDILEFNPEYTKLKPPTSVPIGALAPVSGTTTNSSLGPRALDLPPGDFGEWTFEKASAFLFSMDATTRSTDGRLIFSTYRSVGDSTPDSLTTAGFGDNNNQLIPGSVALSPDLVDRYKPAHGQEIFVNGNSVGFYDDKTASSYKGTPIVNTIDVYDPNNDIGDRLSGLPVGNWNITLGKVRPQPKHPNAK